MPTEPYVFIRGRRCILAEVFFPKKVEYQNVIFMTLKTGLDEDLVRTYLSISVGNLLGEMKEYPQLFDPMQYERATALKPAELPTFEEAQKRMLMYKSRFTGWSMYEVDGVFMENRTLEDELLGGLVKFYDERTQVVRLIFRIESTFESEAKATGCYDVLEAIMRWTMAEHMRLDHILPWSLRERSRFFALHGTWPRHKRAFVNKNYEQIAKEFKRWIDDVSLFIFAYLVRSFSEGVREVGHQEDEIWVVNWLNTNLNVAYSRQ